MTGLELILYTSRDGYGTDQIEKTMTVGELIRYLQDFNEDMPVYTGHDNGYTYGPILERNFEEREREED